VPTLDVGWFILFDQQTILPSVEFFWGHNLVSVHIDWLVTPFFFLQNTVHRCEILYGWELIHFLQGWNFRMLRVTIRLIAMIEESYCMWYAGKRSVFTQVILMCHFLIGWNDWRIFCEKIERCIYFHTMVSPVTLRFVVTSGRILNGIKFDTFEVQITRELRVGHVFCDFHQNTITWFLLRIKHKHCVNFIGGSQGSLNGSGFLEFLSMYFFGGFQEGLNRSRFLDSLSMYFLLGNEYTIYIFKVMN